MPVTEGAFISRVAGFSNEVEQVNKSGLPDDLQLNNDRLGSSGSETTRSLFQAARNAVDLLSGRARESSQSRSRSRSRSRSSHSRPNRNQGAGDLIAPAVPARHVHCPATMERRLVKTGEANGVTVYVPQCEGSGFHTEDTLRELSALARVLLCLAEVFEVPQNRIAIVAGESADMGCGHTGDPSWPLLFPASLQSRGAGVDPAFWFGEFCHALAHCSAGPEHCTEHAWIYQALMAQHLYAFIGVFSSTYRRR